jgi:RNA polymerase sigma factor (sigma-70 family)
MSIGGDDIEALDLVIRRALVEVADPDLAEDLRQETLSRLLAARERLEPATLRVYAWVAARNAVRFHERRESRRHHAERRAAGSAVEEELPGEDPPDAREIAALRAALRQLDPLDAAVLLHRDVEGVPGKVVARQLSLRPGALRIRLMRARARLLVRFLIAYRDVQVSASCLSVLDAVAARDQQRQVRLDSAGHLATCPDCRALIDEVATRRRPGLAWLILGGSAGLVRLIRRHRAASGAAAVVASAATIALVLQLAGGPSLPRPAPVASTTVPVLTRSFLTGGGGRPATSATAPPGSTVTVFGVVLFSKASAEIDAAGAAVIKDAGRQIRESGLTSVAVVGATDADGTPDENDDLANRRAKAVRDQLQVEAPDVQIAATGGRAGDQSAADAPSERSATITVG